MGLGAVLGGLVVATRGRASRELLVGATLSLGASIMLAAVAPVMVAEMAVMVAVGAASTAFIATSNSLLQLHSDNVMRGRVMALFSMVFVGTTPVGGPIVGWVAERFGPRAGLGLGGVATLAAGGVALLLLLRDRSVAGRQRSREHQVGDGSRVGPGSAWTSDEPATSGALPAPAR